MLSFYDTDAQVLMRLLLTERIRVHRFCVAKKYVKRIDRQK